MARQPKTAKPKQKFAKPCLTCGHQPERVVIDGLLVNRCKCGTRASSSSL